MERLGLVFLLDLILFKLKSELLVCIVSSVGARLILKYFFSFSAEEYVFHISHIDQTYSFRAETKTERYLLHVIIL